MKIHKIRQRSVEEVFERCGVRPMLDQPETISAVE